MLNAKHLSGNYQAYAYGPGPLLSYRASTEVARESDNGDGMIERSSSNCDVLFSAAFCRLGCLNVQLHLSS
jgi:hypothetical protein